MTTRQIITNKLREAFLPESLEVQDESHRRLYHIALRRLVSRSTLEQIGRMVTGGDT